MAFDFKRASEADRKKEYDRIAKEIGDDNFFTKKELILFFINYPILTFNSLPFNNLP